MISKKDIPGLADLARLKLKDGEEESLVKDISSILGYVGQVQSFTAAPADQTQIVVRNVLREDTPRAVNDPLAGTEERLRAQFPTREGGHNVVRKIIQKDE